MKSDILLEGEDSPFNTPYPRYRIQVDDGDVCIISNYEDDEALTCAYYSNYRYDATWRTERLKTALALSAGFCSCDLRDFSNRFMRWHDHKGILNLFPKSALADWEYEAIRRAWETMGECEIEILYPDLTFCGYPWYWSKKVCSDKVSEHDLPNLYRGIFHQATYVVNCYDDWDWIEQNISYPFTVLGDAAWFPSKEDLVKFTLRYAGD